MSRATFAVVAVVLTSALLAPRARAEDDEAVRVREALVAAARQGPAAVGKVLEEADALVGPGATFPGRGDLADWLGAMPPAVAELPVVRLRRAWLYVTGKRGADAMPLIATALETEPKNALLRSYLGEAKRQTGDVAGAVGEWVRALGDGATDEQVLPSVRRLVYDLHQVREKDATDALPRYATAAKPVLDLRPARDVAEALADWLFYDADQARADAARSARLIAEGLRWTWAAVRAGVPEPDRLRLARKAYDAGMRRRAVVSPADDLPSAYDLFAQAVRWAETGTEGHGLPEALAALAEEAFEKGRYVLASALCKRRLAISDSPTARRVLAQLPPDVD